MSIPTVEPYRPFPEFTGWAPHAFNSDLFDRFARLLDASKAAAAPEALERAVATATRWAAVDTGAIEGLYEVDRGFTFTVALEAAAWDNIHQLKGARVKKAIHDALAGYEYVLDLVTGLREVTEVWVKELHSVLCGSQETYTVVTAVGPQEQPLPKGQYKAHPNSPRNLASGTVHSYAPVADTPGEMQRLMVQLRSPAFLAAHPVVQAAYAHYAFVCIHPFADGNGRVARALASIYLYRRPGVPLVIFADQKAQYIAALEGADAGEAAVFIQFVGDRAIDTVQMVRTDMARRAGTGVQETLRSLQSSLTSKSGLPHDEVDALAARLSELLQSTMTSELEKLQLKAPISARVGAGSGNLKQQPPGYRLVPSGARVVQIIVDSAPPASGQAMAQYGVAVGRPDNDEGTDFIVFNAQGVLLEVLTRELHPVPSASLVYRLESVAEDQLIAVVNEAVTKGQEALRQQGYTA